MEGIFWFGLDNNNSLKHYENSLKQLKTANTNSPWACILGAYYRKDFASEIWEGVGGRGGGGGGLFSGGFTLGPGIL